MADRRRHLPVHRRGPADRRAAGGTGEPEAGGRGFAAESARAAGPDRAAAPGSGIGAPADRPRAARRPEPGPGAAGRASGTPRPEAPGVRSRVRRADAGDVGPGQATLLGRSWLVDRPAPLEARATGARGRRPRLVPGTGPGPRPGDRVLRPVVAC